MRCQQCGYANQEDHKFCGMCGTRLQTVANAVSINDEDPLGLEGTLTEAGSQRPAQIARSDRQREASRDLRSGNSRPPQRANRSSLSLEDFPPDTAREDAAAEVRQRKRTDHAGEISGPSFLGLGREASNSGFVYDNPRDDAFIYDSPSETPEYLLTEVSRGISWRAWALFLLLLIAAGLGYIQWRASRNEGPDIAAILSGNGAAVGPGGPAMTGNAKPAAPKPNTPAADSSKADATQADGSTDSAGSATASTKTASDSANSSETSKEAADSETTNAKPAGNKASSETNVSNGSPGNAVAAATSTKKTSARDDKEAAAAKPGSDGPDTKVTKSNHAKPAPVEEETEQPKSLGEKDPLIIQAEKYIQGRGVRKNCSTGINLLRQAVGEGNPEADVKMGALYWSGTCVTRSRIAAYEWFSRAHSLEPKNRWIERSRNSLWASMSPSEKQRAGY